MKQKMKKLLIGFFIIMLVANVVCRVRDTYMVSRVVIGRPIRTTLTHALQAEGYFTSSDISYVQPQAGWKIGKIFVAAGSQVEEQDALWQYDIDFLNNLCMEKKAALQKQLLTIEQTQLTYIFESGVSEEALAIQDFQKATKQVAYEQIQLEEAVEKYEKKIAEINKKYDKLEDLARQEYYISCSEEMEDMQKALLETRLDSQIFTLKESRKQEKESAYEEIISQNECLFQAIQNFEGAKQGYDNAVITEQAKQEQQAKSNQSISITQSVLEIEKKHLLDEITYIEEYIQQEGYVYSPNAGNVTCVELVEGHLASGEEKVQVAGVTNTFVFSLPEDEVALLSEGDKCYIRVAGLVRSKEGVIVKLQPEKENNIGFWKVTCIQTDDETWNECRWKQQGTVSIQKKTQEYNCCIPIGALVYQKDAYYCRLVTEEYTILGTEEIIEEVPVMLVDKDATYAYVTGDINEESKVVTDYNKAITDGDRVRVVSRL